jgi:hypothetical protein
MLFFCFESKFSSILWKFQQRIHKLEREREREKEKYHKMRKKKNKPLHDDLYTQIELKMIFQIYIYKYKWKQNDTHESCI